MQHLMLMVTAESGAGNPGIELQELAEKGGGGGYLLVHDILPPVPFGLAAPIIFGKGGDAATDGLHGPIFNVIVQETGGVSDFTFTAGLYGMAY